MKQELRVLCGLHRGACLPLSLGDILTVGSGADCDVVLVDAGVSSLELTLEVQSEGVLFTHGENEGVLVAWGQPTACASVVLVACSAQEPWEFMTPAEMPVPVIAPTELAALDALNTDPLAITTPQSKPMRAIASKPKPKLTLWQRFLASKNMRMRWGLAAVAMLGFTTYSISRNIQQSYANSSKIAAQVELKKQVNDVQQSPLLIAGKLAPESSGSAAQNAGLAQVELQNKLKQRLRNAYLFEKLDLQLSETDWIIRGVLDEDEARLLSRMLTAFYKEHNVKSVLHAQVTSAEEMLPFKIQQFTSGTMANVVTETGQRLYVGDTHLGYTLQKIDGKKLLFAGRNKVEVVW
jgi:type III secretion protein D